ncbi:putative NAD(P)H dehydrogenase (quinone) [Helianthus annuus]|nr:putative NAD(P)H dehydrogenase (quinone) [Helianthus annuus]
MLAVDSRSASDLTEGVTELHPGYPKWTAITQLAHHGMLYVPIGYTFGAGMFKMDSIRGGSPYGAGVYSGDGTREPSQRELELAQHQGKYMAMMVKRFGSHPTQ